MITKLNLKTKHRGFTIIEILVVISIIAFLASSTIFVVTSVRYKAKVAKAQYDIRLIYSAIQMLANDSGEWPGHQPVSEICAAPTDCSKNDICSASDGCDFGLSVGEAGITADDSYTHWSGPYIHQIPLDSWRNEYFFITDYQVNANGNPCSGGGCIDVVVVGSNGLDGEMNSADDIIMIFAK